MLLLAAVSLDGTLPVLCSMQPVCTESLELVVVVSSLVLPFTNPIPKNPKLVQIHDEDERASNSRSLGVPQ